MNYTMLSELLYVGFCFEKGKVYTNYWKPWYRKKLKSQAEIWRKTICIIDKSHLREMDFIIEELKMMSRKYGFKHYDVFISNKGCSSYDSSLSYSFSREQRVIIKFIRALLEDLQRVLIGNDGRKEAYFLLRTLHNLPKALFIEHESIVESHKPISCDDAIEFAFSNMSDEMKLRYQKYQSKNH